MAKLYHHKLQFIARELTPSEQKLAAYIDEHLEGIRGMSSSALAEAAGVSQPTVIRFSKKLGYGSYRQMANDVGVENADEFITAEIEPEDDTATTMAMITQQYGVIVNATFALNSTDSIEQAVAYLTKARRIVVAGFSERNYFLSEYLCYRLEHIGLDAFTHSHSSLLYAKLLNCEAGDVLIVLSESGETPCLINCVKVALQAGMRVISITRFSSNTIQSLSDVNFKVVEYGPRTILRGCMLRLSMHCVVDMLYLNLVKANYMEYRARSVKLSQMTKLSYRAPDPPADRRKGGSRRRQKGD